ncbi:uncharacterized protein LOC142168967 [Nicotiana tabacum]|uniref:Uncharacterized protein LOC142168967 n=1 Tax=Nicotiana tabacum TaxID=4097 RepID=A0AC58SMS0_TOBAC
MKKLWEELNALNAHAQCKCQCTCGAKANMHKAEQDRRLIRFLMGLNEVYTVVRGSILMMNPLPSIAQAFSILIQEEKQREVRPSNHLMMESASMNVSGLANPAFRTNYAQQRNTIGNNSYRGSYPSNRSRLFCDYCKMQGHTKDKCYKLHGFSQDFKFTKGKSVASAASMHGGPEGIVFGGCSEVGARNQSMGIQNLTKEQYNQLLHLLENFHGGSAIEVSNNITSGAANFAGILACSTHKEIIGNLSCKCFKSSVEYWILDSGASNHMSYNKALLTNIRILPYPFLVTLPNGYKVRVTEIGDAVLSPKLTLHKVLFVPSFKFNLISVHCLISYLKTIVQFSDTSCILQAHSMKRPLEIGRARNGLYFLCSKCQFLSSATVPTSLVANSCSASTSNPNNAQPHKSLTVNNDNLETCPANCLSSSSINVPLSSNKKVSSDHTSLPCVLPSFHSDLVCEGHRNAALSNSQSPTGTLPSSVTNVSLPGDQDISPLVDQSNQDSQHMMRNITHESEPCSYEEAALNPAWQAAMTQEFEALHANHTWDLVTLPAVVKMTTVSIAVKRGWNLFQLDVNNTFLHGDLHEEVYTEVPQGLQIEVPSLVCKLNKSLYGLKQASRQWYAKLTEALCTRGFRHSENDHSLFCKKDGLLIVFVAVYVDDVILTDTDVEEIKALKVFLHDQFKIKDLGKLHYFLGLEVFYKDGGVLISQRKFTADLLREYDNQYTTFSSPLDCTIKLKAEEGTLLADPTHYRKLVGKLNFLTNTRLDIAYSVQHLSQFMQTPREPHLKAALHVLRYLKNDPTLGIFFSNNPDCTMKAFCDSDWADALILDDQ